VYGAVGTTQHAAWLLHHGPMITPPSRRGLLSRVDQVRLIRRATEMLYLGLSADRVADELGLEKRLLREWLAAYWVMAEARDRGTQWRVVRVLISRHLEEFDAETERRIEEADNLGRNIESEMAAAMWEAAGLTFLARLRTDDRALFVSAARLRSGTPATVAGLAGLGHLSEDEILEAFGRIAQRARRADLPAPMRIARVIDEWQVTVHRRLADAVLRRSGPLHESVPPTAPD
jgi:hypothetical protein